VIRALLQIAPHLRPTCDKILQFPAIVKRIEEKNFCEIDEIGSNFLLNTIRIPKNMHYLTDRLPKPNYAPLKTKKIDKKRFLQTLAGYQEKDSQDEISQFENIRNSMPEIPYHLPKIKSEIVSNYDKDEIILSKKKNINSIYKDQDEESNYTKKEIILTRKNNHKTRDEDNMDEIILSRKKNVNRSEDRESSINARLNELLENKKIANIDYKKLLEYNANKNSKNDDSNSLISIQKSNKNKPHRQRKIELSPSGLKEEKEEKIK